MTSDHPRFVLVPGDSPVSLPRTMSLRRDGPWGEGRRDAETSEITGTGRAMGTGGEPRPQGSACWPSSEAGQGQQHAVPPGPRGGVWLWTAVQWQLA